MRLIAIKINCDHELEDGLTYYLQDELQAQGIEIRKRSDFLNQDKANDARLVELENIEDLPEDLELTAYFSEDVNVEEIIEKTKQKIKEMEGYGLNSGNVLISTKTVADEDWNTAWQKFYHVINFSRHLAIVPEWEDYHPAFKDQQLIKLDPGLAFGTGGHTTTQLVLLAIERILTKPMTMLDVGTGSGILAIAAAKLGADKILATDISDEAVTAAKENIALNDIATITVKKANLLKDVNKSYDLIVANILADVLLKLIPDLDRHLNKDGKIIFSGIDYLQLPKIEKALNEYGFEIKMKMREKRWVCLLITRKSK